MVRVRNVNLAKPKKSAVKSKKLFKKAIQKDIRKKTIKEKKVQHLALCGGPKAVKIEGPHEVWPPKATQAELDEI
jgi:hypothetical protein